MRVHQFTFKTMQETGQNSRRFLFGSLSHTMLSAVGVLKILIETTKDSGQDSRHFLMWSLLRT